MTCWQANSTANRWPCKCSPNPLLSLSRSLFFSALWLYPFTCQWPAAEDNFEARELAPVNTHWHHMKPSKSKLQVVTQRFMECHHDREIFESPMTTNPLVNNEVVTNQLYVMPVLGQAKQRSGCLIRQGVGRSSCGSTQRNLLKMD